MVTSSIVRLACQQVSKHSSLPPPRDTHRELVTQSLVLLPIALRNGNSTVIVLMVELVVCDVSHPAQTATAIEVVLEVRLHAGPDLDARTVAGVTHRDVVDV